MRVFLAINEPNCIVYMVTYKTKRKKKFVNKVRAIRDMVYWR